MKTLIPNRPPTSFADRQSAGGRCIFCSCTWQKPCDPPCSWHTDKNKEFSGPVCSSCFTAINHLFSWMIGARRPNAAALVRNAKRLVEGQMK